MVSGAAKVIFTETDLSFFIAGFTEGRHCVQITSRRGPINDPQAIGSMVQYREKFGIAIDSSDSDELLQRAFDRGAVLYVNRIAHYTDPSDATTLTAVKASITFKDAQSRDTLTLTAADEGVWGNTMLITISANDADSDFFDLSIEFPEQPDLNETYEYLTMNNTSDYYAVNILNEQSKLVTASDEEAGDPFVGDTVTVAGDPYVGGTDFAIDFDSPSNIATALANAIEAGTATVDMSTASNVATVTAATAGAAGNSITLAVSSVGSNITVSGATLSGGADAIAATGTVTYGSPTPGDTINVDGNTFTAVASGPGAGEFSSITELTALIDALSTVGATDDGSTITVTASTAGVAGNAIVFSSADFTLSPVSGTLSGGVDAVKATGTITISADPTTVDNPAAVTDATMEGGLDGLTSLDADDWIGSSAAATGLYAFDSVEDAIGLATLENNSAEVVAAGIAYCAAREDMVYFCEPPSSDETAADALDFRLGTGSYSHAAFNSSYGTMYFGRPLIRSAKSNSIVDKNNAADVFGVHAYSDAKSEPWYAAAGLRRGLVPNTLGIQYNVGTAARESERDDLVNNQINPIVDFPDEGTVVWGNQTLQRAPSALQSLHIRKLLIVMKKALKKASRIFLFEPNDPVTWRMVYNLLDPWMKDYQDRRAFYEYLIQCDQDAKSIDDAVLNTAERIDRGEFTCRIFIKPTRVMKYIMLDSVITKSGADFTEYLDVRL